MTAIDKDLRQYLTEISEANRTDDALLYSKIKNILRVYTNYNSDIFAVTAVSSSGRAIVYQRLSDEVSKNIWLIQPPGYLKELCTQAANQPRAFMVTESGQSLGRPVIHTVLGL